MVKNCVAMRLGVISVSQATNRKQGGLPVRAPLPPAPPLLVAWESFLTPSWPDTQKDPYKQVELFLFE